MCLDISEKSEIIFKRLGYIYVLQSVKGLFE